MTATLPEPEKAKAKTLTVPEAHQVALRMSGDALSDRLNAAANVINAVSSLIAVAKQR